MHLAKAWDSLLIPLRTVVQYIRRDYTHLKSDFVELIHISDPLHRYKFYIFNQNIANELRIIQCKKIRTSADVIMKNFKKLQLSDYLNT